MPDILDVKHTTAISNRPDDGSEVLLFGSNLRAAIQETRGACEKAALSLNRMTRLRRSTTGRFLLAIERCLLAGEREMNGCRFAWFLDELRNACELADQAEVRNGWGIDERGTFFVAFALESGDVAFSTSNQRIGRRAFPRHAISRDNATVFEEAIAQL